MAGLVFAGAAADAQDAPPPEEGLVAAIQAGKPILTLRPRYALVDQAGFAVDAAALTLRTALGWETAAYRGVKALVELEDVRALVEDFNSTTNGKTAFPVEADPETTELNRAQLSWSGGAGLAATAGRQRIAFDDHRFVGNVGWRQDEQTFDAARLDYVEGPLALSYAYIWGVERVFAEEADWGSDSHLLNASYTVSDVLKVAGFAYALDLEQAPALSTTTYGAALSGTLPVGPLKLAYAARLAEQTDHGDNPRDLDLGYTDVRLTAAHGPLSLGAGYESLEGDGVQGFSTPLATLHAFQGWADVFLTAPPTGIVDATVSAGFAPEWKSAFVSNLAVSLVWHDYEAEQGGADLGSEIDAQLTARFSPKVTGVLKLADYDGPDGAPASLADRTKVWAGLQFAL